MLLADQEDATLAYTVDAAGYLGTHTVGTVLRGLNAANAATTATKAATTATAECLTGDCVDGGTAEIGQTASAPTHAVPAAATTVPLLPARAPLVLLINRGTASSAELFAAALRDNGRGLLVGERTLAMHTARDTLSCTRHL